MVLLAGLLLFLPGGWGRSSNAADAPKPGDVKTLDLGGGVKMDFVWCPPGEFLMGSPASETGRKDDELQHRVTISRGFYLGKYEVTQAQWERVMGSNPSKFKGADLPVESVSWDDCQEFCRKVMNGMRMPTEAEWEYACRAGTDSAWAGDLDQMAWYYKDDNDRKTHPVGQKSPNAWGLYDMHGNVYEWCADWYEDYPNNAVADPQGAPSGWTRMSRGGGWSYSAGFCRSAFRYRASPVFRGNSLGLRVAFTPSGK